VLDGNTAGVGKCMWCGQPRVDLCVLEERPEYSGVLTTLPSPIRVCRGHEIELDAFLRKVARRSPWFLLSVLAGSLVVVTAGVRDSGFLAMSGGLLIGVAAVVFPFATPETISRLGVVRSVRIVRSIGYVIGIVSIAALVWMVFSR
jgi:hypothetical protein